MRLGTDTILVDVNRIRDVIDAIGGLELGLSGEEVFPEGLDERRIGPLVTKLVAIVLERRMIVHHSI